MHLRSTGHVPIGRAPLSVAESADAEDRQQALAEQLDEASQVG